MVHKPKHKVHSFRGLLGDGGQDEINLERQNVNLAYRIVKFQIFPEHTGDKAYESTVQIWKIKQTSVPVEAPVSVNFTDNALLGAAYYGQYASISSAQQAMNVIFDNELFSRNIFVTHTNVESTSAQFSINYYIELEEVPVGAATLMQLKLGTARRLIGAKMGA